MLDLSCLTLVSICTRDHALCRHAIDRCRDKVTFAHTVVFTNSPAEYPGCECLPVPPLTTSGQWSVWRLTEFPKLRAHFPTPQILFIESDSAIIKPAAWRQRFEKVDYLGARWMDGRVGNSGFVLMSQRWLSALASLNLVPDDGACHPCDCMSCCEFWQGRHGHRRRLEDCGCVWGDPELADQFSNESTPYLGAFGIHGKRLLLDLGVVL